MPGLAEGMEGIWFPTSYSFYSPKKSPRAAHAKAVSHIPAWDKEKCLERPHADSLSNVNLVVGTRGAKTERSGPGHSGRNKDHDEQPAVWDSELP